MRGGGGRECATLEEEEKCNTFLLGKKLKAKTL
jgi:hypothetical protein